MDDSTILELLEQRDPAAIRQLSEQFGPYCRRIAKNILGSDQDVEECLNDTYLKVWNAIPPACPERLDAYIGAITRNLALNRFREDHSQRHGSGNFPILLSELSDVVSSAPTPEQELERKELTQAINEFLAALPHWKRFVFIRRYWYADSVSDIAHSTHRSRASISMTLTRLRRKLHDHLTERGFDL